MLRPADAPRYRLRRAARSTPGRPRCPVGDGRCLLQIDVMTELTVYGHRLLGDVRGFDEPGLFKACRGDLVQRPPFKCAESTRPGERRRLLGALGGIGEPLETPVRPGEVEERFHLGVSDARGAREGNGAV